MKPILCLGVMTGTSCDGADLAALSITAGSETLKGVCSKPFPAGLRKKIRNAQKNALSMRETALLQTEYSRWIAAFCSESLRHLKTAKKNVLFGIHGQTLWHEPDNGVSIQMLDPSIVAQKTGCTVVSAFRQPDIAAGGQGAPLVPYYHWLRAQKPEFRKLLPFALHNIGGIANLTCVTKNIKDLIAFDTGPGNALIDLATERATSGRKTFDSDGALARSHQDLIDWRKIRKLASESYFRRKPPKSTGRELFNESYLKKIPGDKFGKIANATALTALTMAQAYARFVLPGLALRQVFICGGGARNSFLLKTFTELLRAESGKQITVSRLPESFAPEQSLEAMAFARLAYEGLKGKPVSLSSVTGAKKNASGALVCPGENYTSLLGRLGK